MKLVFVIITEGKIYLYMKTLEQKKKLLFL
jgi:hypothetical protein